MGSQRVGHDWVTEHHHQKELNCTHQMGESCGTGIISNKAVSGIISNKAVRNNLLT